jgi:hypothetical protein
VASFPSDQVDAFSAAVIELTAGSVSPLVLND